MSQKTKLATADYPALFRDVTHLLEDARRSTVRAVNSIITATYWEIGRRIVEHEQRGKKRAGYGEALMERLARDLTARFGRGFSQRNIFQMREFYLAWPILQTVSAKLKAEELRAVSLSGDTESTAASPLNQKLQTLSAKFKSSRSNLRKPAPTQGGPRFLLPWSHYVLLLSVKDAPARKFYEEEALRGGWSVRQLDRQISTLFYERTALSRKKGSMLQKGRSPEPREHITPEEALKDPLILEFLGLKDEYSESGL